MTFSKIFYTLPVLAGLLLSGCGTDSEEGSVSDRNILNEAPIAIIDDIMQEGTVVRLNGTSSYDLDGFISKYTWTSSTGLQYSSSSAISEVEVAAGEQILHLEVTDNEGLIGESQRNIVVLPTLPEVPAPTTPPATPPVTPPTPPVTPPIEPPTPPIDPPVKNIPPVAKAIACVGTTITEAGCAQTITITEGNEYLLSAKGSNDPDGRIIDYQWKATQISYSGEVVVVLAPTPKTDPETFNYTLSVTDNKGAISKTNVTVIVERKPVVVNLPPVADGVAVGAPFRASRSETRSGTLDGTLSTDDGEIQPLSYSWVPNTGEEASEFLVLQNPNTDTASFSYKCSDNWWRNNCQEENRYTCYYHTTLTVDDGEFSSQKKVSFSVDYTNCSRD